MTQEDKELLFKDVCGRLPYGVKCSYLDIEFKKTTYGNLESFEYDDDKDVIFVIDGIGIYSEHVKPYLFPMSSMTEEQKEELKMICDWHDDEEDAQSVLVLYHKHFVMKSDVIDWFNKNHFDWRGLIPKGLANDAIGLNIY